MKMDAGSVTRTERHWKNSLSLLIGTSIICWTATVAAQMVSTTAAGGESGQVPASSPPAVAGQQQAAPVESVPIHPSVRTSAFPPASAVVASPSAAGAPAPATGSYVNAKFATELYGFVEFDSILDSRQGLNEIAGNAVLPKSGTFAGEHQRLTFSARNSRLGFKIRGGDTEAVHASGIVEMDFLGNQPSPVSEAALLTNPTFRIRHMALKVETPYVDVMAGQYWQLFGWQSYFFPNSVEIMGLPGQVFGRAPQLRVSHSFKTDAVTVEVAAAASRSPQRDSGLPDTQGGIRLLLNRWKGVRTANSTGTAIDAAALGVSGVYRKLRVNEFSATPSGERSVDGRGISVDLLLPIIPATADDRAFGLTLTASYVRGTGISDLFTGLTGGVSNPGLPNPTMASPAPAYTPNIDPGLVVYNAAGDLHTIDWQSVMGGLQFYLTRSGRVWLSTNASQMNSPNMDTYTSAPGMAGRAVKRSRFADANLFVDLTKAVRVGAEVAWFEQRFVDQATAQTFRYQLSAFYMF